MLVPITIAQALEGCGQALARVEARYANSNMQDPLPDEVTIDTEYGSYSIWSPVALSLRLRQRALMNMDQTVIVYINSDTYPNGISGQINIDGLIFDELFGAMQA